MAHYPRGNSSLPANEEESVLHRQYEALTVAVAEKPASEVAARQFSVVPRRIRGGLVTLPASDNFRIAQIARLLRSTTLPTAII